MTTFKKLRKLPFIILTSIIFGQAYLITPANALEISIPPSALISGETGKIHLQIDKTDNLAGVRIVLSFNPKDLHYVGALKTAHTAQMMYVVNDKKPGALIIVMAGAQGIKGENFSLLDLSFKADKVKVKKTSRIEIKEAQLMSDKLKDLPCAIRVSPVIISPQITTP